MFETFTLNITVSKWERRVRNGRTYIVADATLIVPGVLPGSEGPLYYPPDEVAKEPHKWNRKPITLGHPQDPLTNSNISANDPEVLEAVGLGFVEDAQIHNANLISKLWFDEVKTNRLSPSVLQLVMAGKPVELSTGLYTANKKAPQGSNHKGRPYTHIATNYRPDHLAILLDKRGACSLEDGCGVGVLATNASSMPSEDIDPDKACQILHDGEANGHELTDEQRKMFGAACSSTKNELIDNTWSDAARAAALEARKGSSSKQALDKTKNATRATGEARRATLGARGGGSSSEAHENAITGHQLAAEAHAEAAKQHDSEGNMEAAGAHYEAAHGHSKAASFHERQAHSEKIRGNEWYVVWNEFASDEQRNAFFGMLKKGGGDEKGGGSGDGSSGKEAAKLSEEAHTKSASANRGSRASGHVKAAELHTAAAKAHFALAKSASDKGVKEKHESAAKEHNALVKHHEEKAKKATRNEEFDAPDETEASFFGRFFNWVTNGRFQPRLHQSKRFTRHPAKGDVAEAARKGAAGQTDDKDEEEEETTTTSPETPKSDDEEKKKPSPETPAVVETPVETTGNQLEDVMVTKEQFVANCKCDKLKATVNGLSKEQWEALGPTIVANAPAKVGKDGKVKKVSNKDADASDDDDDDDEEEIVVKKKKTMNEWLEEEGSDEDREIWNHARNQAKADKKKYALQLVANIKDEAERKEMYKDFMRKSLGELKRLVKILPVTNRRHEEDDDSDEMPTGNQGNDVYVGIGGLTRPPVFNSDADKDDVEAMTRSPEPYTPTWAHRAGTATTTNATK